MATCPKCGGFLNETHRCPRRWPVMAAGTGIILTGSLLGMYVMAQQPGLPAGSAVALGGLASASAWAWFRSIRGRGKRDRAVSVGRAADALPPAPVAGLPPAVGTAAAVGGPPCGPPSVLVVDDEAAVRTLLMRWLEPLGYGVRQSASAIEAMAAMAVEPAAIMLCDVKMPGQDGLWLAERVHARWPQTAIIMATGAHDVETVMTSRKIGAVAYVTKPFGRELLIQALRKASPEVES
jgi:CheY-like chemotaxis protein